MTFVALNNTYGLVVIVFLLGYGLVELPKQMWMVGARHNILADSLPNPHRKADLPVRPPHPDTGRQPASQAAPYAGINGVATLGT